MTWPPFLWRIKVGAIENEINDIRLIPGLFRITREDMGFHSTDIESLTGYRPPILATFKEAIQHRPLHSVGLVY